jgi:serine/threonine-protein phosphatase 4 regulatory subunit 4
MARVSADDIDVLEKNAGSISPFIIKSKNCFSHNRKRSSVTR